MNVVFRCDASIQIGTGHVMRCLTLADELTSQGAKCYFICREHKGNLIDFITQKGYEVYKLEAIPLNNSNRDEAESTLSHSEWLGTSQAEDAKQSIDIVSTIQPKWLVIDHYALDSYWEKKLRTYCNKILVIDDLADRKHDCDVLLDQNFLPNFKKRYDGLVSDRTIQLLGPSYTILKNEYFKIRAFERQIEPFVKPQVLVNFGGIGNFRLLSIFINAANQNPQFKYAIITGALEPEQFKQLEDIIAGDHITLSNYTTEMPKLMSQSQFAIGACGSTVWERFCLGLNSALVEMAENQHPLITYLESERLIDNLGHKDILSSTKISSFLNSLDIKSPTYSKRKERIMNLVDGLGAQRISNVIYKL
tara:strand:+ start:12152 stop:13243 length:1092 start_codon:yes stop_codon:yes gene_type:complete